MHKIDKHLAKYKIKGEWDLTLLMPSDCLLFVAKHGFDYAEEHDEEVCVTFRYEYNTYYLFMNVFDGKFTYAGFHTSNTELETFNAIFESAMKELK